MALVDDHAAESGGIEPPHPLVPVLAGGLRLDRRDDDLGLPAEHRDDAAVGHLHLHVGAGEAVDGGLSLLDELRAVGEHHRAPSGRLAEEALDDRREDDGLAEPRRHGDEDRAVGLPGFEHRLDGGLLIVS